MKIFARCIGAAAVCAAIQGGAVAASTAAVATHIVNTPAHVAVSHDSQTSTNWSGYAVQDTTKFNEVIGTWVQPKVTCSGTTTKYSSFWVGIDGYASNSVEQLGTDSDCRGTTPSYYGWYEMYPAASINISRSSYPVKPGDTLTAEVSISGNTYVLSMKSSEGWTFSKTETGTSTLKDASAEWIAESPEVGGSIAKLSDFGTVGWTNCEASIVGGSLEPISFFTDDSGPHAITMDNAKKVTRATPSALNTSGENFTITWHHS